jgi:hypothetical protein
MRKSGLIFVVTAVVLCGACNMIGIMGSKSYHEQKIPAELALEEQAERGVLVFVEEAGGGRGSPDLHSQLTDMVIAFLVKKARINSEYLVPQSKLSQLRSQRDDFSRISPVEVGAGAGAGIVLYTVVEHYELYEIQGRGYHNGSLVTRSIMFDVASGRALWPLQGGGRVVRVKVELETAGRVAILNRLITATAHCITRSFYDCPRTKFRTADEQTDYNMEKW